MTSHADFDADSFDDDFDDEEDESRSQPVEDIAAHYDHADKYRWLEVGWVKNHDSEKDEFNKRENLNPW